LAVIEGALRQITGLLTVQGETIERQSGIIERQNETLARQEERIGKLTEHLNAAQEGRFQAITQVARLTLKAASPPLSPWDREEAERRLRAFVAGQEEAGISRAARAIGVSRPLVSRVLSPADPTTMSDKMARRILANLPRIEFVLADGAVLANGAVLADGAVQQGEWKREGGAA
jgi:uncharacterized coiled-coil protein SlyX